jgi:hypothetical protein
MGSKHVVDGGRERLRSEENKGGGGKRGFVGCITKWRYCIGQPSRFGMLEPLCRNAVLLLYL